MSELADRILDEAMYGSISEEQSESVAQAVRLLVEAFGGDAACDLDLELIQSSNEAGTAKGIELALQFRNKGFAPAAPREALS
jgi:hypothetical protein